MTLPWIAMMIALVPAQLAARPPASTGVECGIDVLKSEEFRSLRGLSIGLVTNHTGVTREGKSTIDVLLMPPKSSSSGSSVPSMGFAANLTRP